IEEISQRHDIHVANVAHAGDGNLHPLIITEAGDEGAKARAQLAFDEILDEATALGGTGTGEPGGGLLKRAGMGKGRGEAGAGKARDGPVRGARGPGRVPRRVCGGTRDRCGPARCGTGCWAGRPADGRPVRSAAVGAGGATAGGGGTEAPRTGLAEVGSVDGAGRAGPGKRRIREHAPQETG
ncbi:FAD-linked oxidase C-terminal domain-containing protein, partial [Streptomyces albidoflavus]|uniref:FAD-linked oxidase C-terminal domain-containing protein n=1 Tax=Streptomyces albidoflavus TaxID=1886 RepID=UPI0027B9617A